MTIFSELSRRLLLKYHRHSPSMASHRDSSQSLEPIFEYIPIPYKSNKGKIFKAL